MQGYENKAALITEVRRTYRLFDAEFADVPEDQRMRRMDQVDRTPQEMLAYQLGWLTLVMDWERRELDGHTVTTPSDDYKWNQLGLLYQQFYCDYAPYSLSELRIRLKEKVDSWCTWIDGLSDEELFTSGVRKWTVTAAHWPMWKWIHTNSVAPFKSFRTKIRKWKKYS